MHEPILIADSLPPWKRNLLKININLAEYKKKDTPDEVFRRLHQEMIQNLNPDHIFYTDGSHRDHSSSYAVVKWEQHLQFSTEWQGLLPNEAGSYIAEIAAINKAIVIANSHIGRSVIFTDNLGILKGLKNETNRCPTLEQLRRMLKDNIILAWVPGHTGIKGNESADDAAKNAINYPLIIETPNLFQLTRQTFLQQLKMEVESNWNNCNTFLRTHNPHHTRIPYNRRFTREDCIKILRIRVGKTIFTSKHLYNGDPPEECEQCHQTLSIHHIFVECPLSRQINPSLEITGISKQLSIILNPADYNTIQKIKTVLDAHNKFNEI